MEETVEFSYIVEDQIMAYLVGENQWIGINQEIV